MKKIVLMGLLCGVLMGCEGRLSLNESNIRKTVCHSKGGEYIVYMGSDGKSARGSTCKVDGVEYRFWYSRGTGSNPQL